MAPTSLGVMEARGRGVGFGGGGERERGRLGVYLLSTAPENRWRCVCCLGTWVHRAGESLERMVGWGGMYVSCNCCQREQLWSGSKMSREAFALKSSINKLQAA